MTLMTRLRNLRRRPHRNTLSYILRDYIRYFTKPRNKCISCKCVKFDFENEEKICFHCEKPNNYFFQESFHIFPHCPDWLPSPEFIAYLKNKEPTNEDKIGGILL